MDRDANLTELLRSSEDDSMRILARRREAAAKLAAAPPTDIDLVINEHSQLSAQLCLEIAKLKTLLDSIMYTYEQQCPPTSESSSEISAAYGSICSVSTMFSMYNYQHDTIVGALRQRE